MLNIWTLIGFVVISFVGGIVTGAVALFLGGAGSLRVLAKRLNVLEERQDDLDDRMVREVKARAGKKGVEVRRTAAEAEEEAQKVLSLVDHPIGTQSDPSRPRRPSVFRR